MTLTTKDIYQAYQEEKAAREAAGFSMAGSLAVEDTAWMLDLSLADVCRAISVEEVC